MARGRMIDNCISTSEKINDLSLREAFIYTWIIPHLDDWGRVTGSPRKLKALIFPMKKEISISIIEKTLTKLKSIGLFLWEDIDGVLVLQQPFDEFNDHQSISESKRSKSKYPEILGVSQEMPRNAKKCQENPAQENLREVNLIKDKYREYVFLLKEEYQKLCNRFGDITTDEWIEELNNWLGKSIKNRNKNDSHYYTILAWQRRTPKPIQRSQEQEKEIYKKRIKEEDGEINTDPKVMKDIILEIKKKLGINKTVEGIEK